MVLVSESKIDLFFQFKILRSNIVDDNFDRNILKGQIK